MYGQVLNLLISLMFYIFNQDYCWVVFKLFQPYDLTRRMQGLDLGRIQMGELVLYLATSSKVIIFNRLGSMYFTAFYLKLLPKVLFQVKQAQKQLRLRNFKSIITWLMPDDPLWYILIVKKITYTFFLPDPPLHHNYNRDDHDLYTLSWFTWKSKGP